MAIKHFWYKLYAKQGLLYKLFLAVILVVAMSFLLPKGSKFSYEFQPGKPWLYPALYAPFDFTLKKTNEQLSKEREYIESQSPTYFFRDTTVLASVQKNYYQKARTYFASEEPVLQEKLVHKGEDFLKKAYHYGVFYASDELTDKKVFLVEGNEVFTFAPTKFFFLNQTKDAVLSYFSEKPFAPYMDTYYAILSEVMLPDIFVNEYFTQRTLEEQLKNIVHSYGIVKKGQLIIEKGQFVSGERLTMLSSLQKEYALNGAEHLTTLSFLGYILIISMLVSIILLYLYHF